ncbi:MAG: HD domain-containing protein [Flavobacteriales bacterium]|nr:HD domain-containing protein [Flavobacteriales bacterium]
MADTEKKGVSGKKVARFKDKIHIKDLQLDVLLEITNAINNNLPVLEILEKFEMFVKNELNIEKLLLYSKGKKWRCLLQYEVDYSELDNIDVERDLIGVTDITSVSSLECDSLSSFDMVLPVFKGGEPLAYLILGDQDNDALAVSSIIKHLNFLQLLSNIVVSSILNRQLAREKRKQEDAKKKLIEEQNEMLEKEVAIRTNELVHQKDESERLLHNILPKEVADELKKKGKTRAQTFSEASLLFTDFKGFTKQSSKMNPQELVNELDDIFHHFDNIMSNHGMEKIKTIGDAYMAACGLPKKSKMHAVQSVRAALDMIAYLKERGKHAKIKWEMRAGIHSGPLVAGVVGYKKFTYDVWGDTVNTAARMESNSEPGKLNISAVTYNLVGKYFNCEHRGKIEAKGKGEIDMYFVKGEVESDRVIKTRKRVFKLLKRKLPQNRFYHDYRHTLDVHNAAVNLGIMENIKDNEMDLLKVAALYHDSGFTVSGENHEEVGCGIARKDLPGLGFNKKEIDKICGIIMATKIPQSPSTKLQQIICDSDLDYLGRGDFETIGITLFRELNANGITLSVEDWNKMQVKFLNAHTYFTKSSKSIREPIKQEHLKKLVNLVDTY